MAPRPLFEVNKNASSAFGEQAANLRPELSLLVMQTIIQYTQMDAELGVVFTELLDVKADHGAAIFLAVKNDNAQLGMLDAAARSVLTGGTVAAPGEYEVFTAIIELAAAAAKDRHRFCHWIMGWSGDLPDALLFMNPDAEIRRRAVWAAYETVMYTETPPGPPGARIPQFVDDFRSRRMSILVYERSDIMDSRARIETAKRYLWQLTSMITARQHGLGDQARQELSALPEIAKILQDRRDRSKSAP